MNGFIIYRSRYGATRQYAAWLSAELKIPAIPQEQATPEIIANAGFLILGSSIYIGKLLMRNWLKQHAAQLQKKRLFIFLVTATKKDKQEKLRSYVQQNIPACFEDNCRYYFFPGKIIYDQLSLMDKLKVKLGGQIAKLSNKPLNISDFNDVNRSHIGGLLSDMRLLYAMDNPVNQKVI
ncbi:Protoporphyrinogen IX oxidase, menaquinone-dependent (flavodoxin domain) [Chitinophaga rupis]|uniref:Protoporphyrinogen IX oxidase, menaquinone-dependent (Flavodoxin domain) n=1 Tax=Chitinophaga rupis TaxID=573321 RepID=A0A1H8HGM8_9BACT|nr:flavodoxin domain-containing protein [Chitinophaga rupis]SEN55179.1 Protoporphyrinogen IX oxidase, menaquinone-dependent (flavodoxin domain) [Chitinophaga rupis]